MEEAEFELRENQEQHAGMQGPRGAVLQTPGTSHLHETGGKNQKRQDYDGSDES